MSPRQPLIRVLEEPVGPGDRVDILHTASLTAAALFAVHSMEDETIVSFAPSSPGDRDLADRFVAASDVVTLTEADAAWLYPGVAVDAVIGRLLRRGPALIAVECTRGWTLETRCASLARPAASTAHRVVSGLLIGLADLWVDGCDAEELRSGLTTVRLDRIGQVFVAGESVARAAMRVPAAESHASPAA
jgi:fructokinase